mmetsp:Transcript_27713/g.33876  ORF Transcript_27713/g.33876 Transcript_27713/m.33876 type:complete len:411 (+) Transcript_27713:386-1618(+)
MMVAHGHSLSPSPSNCISVHTLRDDCDSSHKKETKDLVFNCSVNSKVKSENRKMNVCLHGHSISNREVGDRSSSFNNNLWNSPGVQSLPNFSTCSPSVDMNVNSYIKTVDQLHFSPGLEMLNEDSDFPNSSHIRTRSSSSTSTCDKDEDTDNNNSGGMIKIHSHRQPLRTNSVLLLSSVGWLGQNPCGESGERNADNSNNSDSRSKSKILRPRAFSVGASPEKCACGKKWSESGNFSLGLLRSASFDSNVDIEDMMTRHSDGWDENELMAELVEGTPKLLLSSYHQEDEETETKVRKGKSDAKACVTCGSRNCLSVQPTLGYYKKEQVEKHCRPDDCWITAHGVVYDVTRYIAKHPGGAQSILRRAGQDCSHDYDFHSSYSRKKLWRRFRIGQLAYCTGKAASEENCVIC